VRRWVWSRNFVNEEALTQWGLSRRKNKNFWYVKVEDVVVWFCLYTTIDLFVKTTWRILSTKKPFRNPNTTDNFLQHIWTTNWRLTSTDYIWSPNDIRMYMLVSSIIFPAKTFTSVPCAQNWFCTLQWPAVGPDLLESSSSELAHITSRQINYRWVFMPIEATSLPLWVPCNFPSSYYTSDLEMKLIYKAFVNTKTYVYYT